MFSQKDYNQRLGTCATTIKSAGCFITSCCNLFPRLIDFKMTPPELNDYCKNGIYFEGCLLSAPTLAKKLGMTYNKTTANPKTTCIAETDHYKSKGIPQHFFMWKPDNSIIDPLDLNPDFKVNPYHIVSWRVFKAPKIDAGEENKPEEPSKCDTQLKSCQNALCEVTEALEIERKAVGDLIEEKGEIKRQLKECQAKMEELSIGDLIHLIFRKLWK